MSGYPTIQSHLSYRQMRNGRREYVLRSMLGIARSLGLHDLVSFLERAVAFEAKTADVDEQWKVQKKSTSSSRGNARALDYRIDAEVSSIARIVREHAAGSEQSPRVKLAIEFLEGAFPLGVGAMTQLPFEEQLQQMDRLVDKLTGPFAASVKAFALDDKVEVLASLVESFRAELDKYQPTGVTWDQVVAHHAKGNENVAIAVVRILGIYWSDDESSVSCRQGLLREYYRQQEAVLAAYRSKRAPADVDPQTGEELPDDVLDADLQVA